MSHYFFDLDVSAYSSAAQIARLKTEAWVGSVVYCPDCGQDLTASTNNSQACDFICSSCSEQFELKSKNGKIGFKLVNGAFSTLIKRLESDTNPNLFVLQYNRVDWCVENFFVIPRYFFVPEIIEKRKPLALTARRAG